MTDSSPVQTDLINNLLDLNPQCIICFDQINQNNFVLAKINSEWKLNSYCKDCVEYYKSIMWKNYISNIINADCKKSLDRSINYPMPKFLTDNSSLTGNQISSLYYNDSYMDSRLEIEFNEDTLNQMIMDIEIIKNEMSDDDYDYLSHIELFSRKYNLEKYKKTS